MSSIDNGRALNAIDSIIQSVKDCFNKCKEKGSSFSGEERLKNLEQAIDSIPQSQSPSGGYPAPEGSTPSIRVVAGDLELFTIKNYYSTDTMVIDFSKYGVTWQTIYCWGSENQGHFSIHRISKDVAIVSACSLYDGENKWTEDSGIFLEARQSLRTDVEINGNMMSFSTNDYCITEGVQRDSDNMLIQMSRQVSTYNDPFYLNQYKLDKITVLV